MEDSFANSFLAAMLKCFYESFKNIFQLSTYESKIFNVFIVFVLKSTDLF